MKSRDPLDYLYQLGYLNYGFTSDFKKRTAYYLKSARINYMLLLKDKREKENFVVLPAKNYAQIAALLYLTEQINRAAGNAVPEKVHTLDKTALHFHVTLPSENSTTHTRLLSDDAFQDLDRNVIHAIHNQEAAQQTVQHILRTVCRALPRPALIEETDDDDDTGLALLSDFIDFNDDEEKVQLPKTLNKLFCDTLNSLPLRDHACQCDDYLIIFHVTENTLVVDRVLSLDDHNLYLLYEEEDDDLEKDYGLFDNIVCRNLF